jgi:putative intracellular protease/amidase
MRRSGNGSPTLDGMSLKDPNVTNAKKRKRVAIVLANPALSTTTQWPVGFWWSELTHPYFLMTENGYEVAIFSPKGGKCEADAMSDPRHDSGYSAEDLISLGFINSPKHAALIEHTRPVSEIDVEHFDAILVAGGQAPMFTFDSAHELCMKFVEFYEAGKLAVALCHGVAILRYAKLSNGEYLAKGKTVTGFANVEEDFADDAVWGMKLLPRGQHVMPWRIEDEIKKIGANFVHGGLWRAFSVRDGNLITGQQNYSGSETAELLVRTLGA